MTSPDTLGLLFAWLTVPCGALSAFFGLVWASDELSVENRPTVAAVVLGAAAMWAVLLILSGAL